MNNKPIFLHATNLRKVELGLSQSGENLKFFVLSLNLFRTEFVESSVDLPKNVPIVISSSRTVEWLRLHTHLFPILATCRVYVVGNQTASLYTEVTGQSVVVGTHGFQSLPVSELAEGSGIVLGGEHLAKPTQQFLDDHPQWNHRVVYRRILTQYAGVIDWSTVHTTLVTSPRVGDEFVRLGMPKKGRILCLGDTTKTHMKSMGYTNVQIVGQSISETVAWFSRHFNHDTQK